eukprot:Rhum_TRINITY_DN14584_c8_g1::Rhum_TRINITY_DN14584_c8_g1_i1::g.99588::m.99588
MLCGRSLRGRGCLLAATGVSPSPSPEDSSDVSENGGVRFAAAGSTALSADSDSVVAAAATVAVLCCQTRAAAAAASVGRSAKTGGDAGADESCSGVIVDVAAAAVAAASGSLLRLAGTGGRGGVHLPAAGVRRASASTPTSAVATAGDVPWWQGVRGCVPAAAAAGRAAGDVAAWHGVMAPVPRDAARGVSGPVAASQASAAGAIGDVPHACDGGRVDVATSSVSQLRGGARGDVDACRGVIAWVPASTDTDGAGDVHACAVRGGVVCDPAAAGGEEGDGAAPATGEVLQSTTGGLGGGTKGIGDVARVSSATRGACVVKLIGDVCRSCRSASGGGVGGGAG